MTSNSISFQPKMYFSTSTWCMGEASRPAAATVSISSSLWAMPPPRAAEGEGGADDDGVADGVRRGEGGGQGLRRAGGDGGLAYLGHGVLEELPVLALEDGVDVGADEPDAVLAQEAGLVQLHGEVQARLPAEAGEQAVGLFLLDYALHRALG